MRYIQDDGGRADSGFKGSAGDCATRAIAIATGDPYRATYNALGELAAEMTGGLETSVRNGVSQAVFHRYITDGGWALTLTPGAYFVPESLPKQRVCIAVLHRHWVAVSVDGVVRDTWDSRKSNRTRCGAPKLLGYYT